MKNFVKHLNAFSVAVSFAAVLFVLSNNANAQCSETSAYSTSPQTANNTGSTLNWNQDAQDYVAMNGCINGGQYTVSSATSSDYITIRTGNANNGTVITSGTTPITFNATATTIYIINNTNSSCGTHNQSRVLSMVYTTPPTITSIPSSACAGSTFNITGTYLSNVTSVSVHGTNAPIFTVNSSTSITVTIPSGATTGTVSVTATQGTATSSSSITINLAPTDNSGANSSICNGASTTLGAASTAGHTYSWSPAIGLSSSTKSNPTANPTTTTTYTLTETITSTGCNAANTTVVTVNPLPSDNSGANQTTCNGTGVAIGASSTTGHTYSWSPSATLNSSTTANPTATPTTATTYTLTETITATGCSAANTTVVTVNAAPTDNSGANESICSGASVAIGASSTTGHTYKWSPSTGLNSSTTSSPTANPTTTTTYTLTETITATSCSVANTTVVTVNPLPTDNSGANQSTCGGLATLGASSTTGHTYSWTPSSGLSSSTVSNPTCTPTVTTTYTLTETITATGCSAANTTVITVNPVPTDNSGGNQTTCSGIGVTIGASSTTGHTYSWSPSATLSSSTTANPTANPTTATTYTLTETITATGCSAANTTVVTVSAAPSDNSGANQSICNGASVAIGASATTGHTYKWSPSTTLNSSTTSNPTANPTTTTTYTLTETITTTGCSVANTTVVTVNPLPTDNSGANQTTCSGTGVTIGASSTTGHTYSWSPSATLSSSTAANPTANPTTTTTYTLTETITVTGCSTSNTTVVTDNTLPTNITPTGTATICSGNSANISIANSQSGVKYQLRNNSGNASVGSAVAGSGGTISLPTGSLSSTTTFNVLATNATTSCSLQMTGTITITVNAAPSNDAGSAQSFCKSGSAALGASSTSGHTYSWSPSTGLTSAATSNPTATPTATTTYTLTETITATGCSAVNSVVVTVNSLPTASITPNYCNGGGNVQLTATTNSSYLWSNGGTNSSITVNTAGTYTVTVTNAAGCTATNIDTVAVELVQNGDFSEGNVGFTSAYTYTSAADGLLPEGLYAVGSNANYYHPNFFGTAETGSGNFMIVNGAGTPVTVWSETVTLVPNTYYYFSAWAMSMNDDNPWAVLQFAINGVQVGTIDSLTTGVESTSGPFVWTRFYATWNSGTSTTATLSITDLQTAANGNDFGLSNISCSTLSTVPLSASPSTNAPVCAGSTLKISSNILGGMYPMTYSWTGPNSFTSTSINDSITNPTTAASGVYNLTVTDEHGCTVSASTSSAAVNAIPTDITPTAASPAICTGNSTNIQIANSQSGVNYQLRNNSGNSTIGSAVAGTGGSINLSTGTLTSSTTFNVLATNATTSCSHQMVNTVTVTVNQNATISLSSASGTNTQSLCENTAITNITYNIGGGGTGGGVGGLPAGVTGSYSGGVFTISGAPTAGGTFNYTVSTTGNCTQATATGTITVNLVPGNDAGSSASICAGSATGATLGASSTTGHTYSWSPATGLNSSTTSNPIAKVAATTTYTLTETITSTGCSAANAVVVTVNPIPGNDAGSNPVICNGTSTTIGATSTTGHTYSWSPSTGLSSSTAANPTANPTATTTYTLTETITASGCSAANTVSVTVNTSPGNDAGSNKTICSGASTTVGATSTTGHTYSWSPSTGLSSSTTSNPSAYPTSSTTYTLTETITASGCSAVNTASVTVNALPGNDAGSNATVCNGASTAIGAASTTGHTYSWSPATGLSSSTAANPTADPTAATTYTLTETITASGCSAANTVSVTVNALPGNDAGSNASICSGASTTIGAASTTGHTYSWSPSTGLSNSTTSNPSAYPTSSTTYTLTETITASGCSVANTVSVTVNATPVNDAGSNKTICSGTSTAIGATSTTGHAYSWSPATGLSTSTAANPTANPTSTTTYTLTETITASGCSAANTVSVTVNALPGNNAGSNASICSGAGTTIGATSTTGHTYSWSPTTGLSSSTAANPTANPTTATTYTLTETITASGCSAANTVSVTVNAAPGNNAGSNATVCSGASATIGAASTTGHTYSWSPATGLTSSTTANPTANPTTTTTYTLTETITASGCSASNSVSVTVNATPGNNAGSNATNCSGAGVTIGATSTTGHTYSWSPATGLTSSTAANPTTSPTATTTYTLTETITATGCSASNTVAVTINAAPGNNAGTNKTICSGASTTIGATSTTGHTYNWSPSTGLSSSTASNPNAYPTTTTTYTLTETITASGCSVSNTVSVTVNATPGNDAGSNATICSGASTTIGATSTTGHTYSWSPTTGLTSSTAANPTANPTAATTYTLTETITASGCSAANTVSVNVNALPGNNAGANASICSGASTSIGATSTTGHTYSWSPSTGLSSSTTSNPSAYPTATTTYTLTETITATGCSASNTVSVTVNALPGNDAGSGKTICSGASTTIGAASTTGHTYSWSPSTGLTSSTTANPIANPIATTTYTLTEIITASGCSTANTASITVNALPGNDAGSNATICSGASASVGATSTTGHTYSWSPSTGLSSSTAANPTANPATATTYTLTETITASGCSASNSVSVTVNATPGNNAGSNANICSGSSATIGAASTTGHTYSWSPATGLTSSTTANPTASPTATTTYTLTETITTSGCSVSNTASVTVNATPGNNAGSNATNCSGAGVAIGATSTTGHTYSWSPATGLTSSTTANPTASPTATTTYTLTETITASGCSTSNTVSVTINAAPGNNAGSNKTICSGTSTTIGAASTTGHTYSWSPSTGLSSSTASNPTASSTATTTYTLTETITSSGCSASNTASVTVNALPGNDAGASTTSICSGSSTALGATSTTGHTYSWSPSTGLTSSTNSKPTANPTTTTTYTLTETITATGCSAANTAVVSVSTTLSITQQPANETICSGSGSSVNFTTTASGGSTTYQWWQLKTGLLQFWASLSDGTNSAGATLSGSATNTLTISNAPSSMSGWTYYCVETNVCNSVTSSTVSLTVAGSAGTWIGSISTDWNNAGNWCGSVPTSTTNVTIPSGTTYSAIISGSAECNNLTINSGATLTITTNGHLHLYGTPTVNGTYTNNSGTLELDGTSAQTLPAITVDTVIVNNSSGVTLNGNLTVSGLLTFTTGIITTGSNQVDVTNNAIASITGYSNSNYIFGNLQRSVSSSGSYDYPVGTSSKYEFINITLSGTSGFTNIVGSFTNSNPLENLLGSLLSLNILVGGTSLTSLLNYGYWTLTPNSTMTAGSYTVEAHEQGQSNAGLTPNSYALVKRHDASSSWAASGTHSNSTQSVTNGVVKAVCSNLTSFSDYSIGYGGGVLPIQLESFTAQKTDDDKDALLLWITAAEEDNNHFDIEVASDVNPNGDLNFKKIGEVPGNGTSFVQHDYSFIDTEANKNGIYYYRLKQVNNDSTFSYSNIAPLTFENTNATASVVLSSLYPNPVINTLFFNVQSQGDMGVDIMVNNMAGQEVFKERIQLGIGSNSFNFDVSELLRAMYLFNLFGDNNNLKIDRKFEKQ